MVKDVSFTQALYEALALIITGVGLTIDPAAFIGCLFFASAGSAVSRGWDPVAKTRRGVWLVLMTSLLFSLALLLLNEHMPVQKEWWPYLPPQFIALTGGLFGPIAVPFLLRRFPGLAERLVGRVFPEKEKREG